MKILIVDRDKELAESINGELKEPQDEVQYAADGERGLTIALARSFDLIVLGWLLPGKSGLTVLRELRKKNNLTPILMLTAEDTVSDVVLSLNCGANSCITGPVKIPELIARMKAVVRRSQWDRTNDDRYGHLDLDPVIFL